MRFKIPIILVIFLLILGLSFPTTVQAKGKKIPPGVPFKLLLEKINALTERVEALEDQVDGHLLIEIVVSADFIQLGDEQPTWETIVNIQEDELSRSKYAAVEFVAVNVWEGTSDNLIVNGRKYVLPISEPLSTADIPFRGKTVIPIPVGVLQEGDNTIGFESGPINNPPTNLWDDFEVGDIVLVLSH
jgi:hypothetical protein